MLDYRTKHLVINTLDLSHAICDNRAFSLSTRPSVMLLKSVGTFDDKK